MQGIQLKSVLVFALLLLMSILLMQFAWQVSGSGQADEVVPSEKVNLALRRTAHHLLTEAGDSTSRIPPVEQIANNVWLIRLERPFNYERLPVLLKESFEIHAIRSNYDVAVLRCLDGELLLGYNFQDFEENNEVPCGGRDMASDCYNIQVSFPGEAEKGQGFPPGGWFLSSILAVALFAGVRKWLRVPAKTEAPEAAVNETEWLSFGDSRLDVANQILVCAGTRNELTYRETKLLHLFVSRPNQLLERSFILQNVWEDEGIMVGRSVDMFVSRLRKMLRADSSVQITAVHGVGYRLETTG